MTIPAQRFLERVLVWPGENDPGYINLHWLRPGTKSFGMPGRAFRDPDTFMKMVEWACGKPPDVIGNLFFCLSTQARMTPTEGKDGKIRNVAERHASDALWIKALWLDVDIKLAGYPTLAAALRAVTKFWQDAGLPAPSALVFSGGGLHVYWISDKPLTANEWRPYAEGLKAEAIRLGLKCDASITADAARVLRVPDTTNFKKDPIAVRILGEGPDYNFAVDMARLAQIAPVTGAVTRSNTTIPHAMLVERPSAVFDDTIGEDDHLAAGLEYNQNPLPFSEVVKYCPHFKDAVATGGAGYRQGLWMLDVLACTFVEDGLAHAIEVSQGYSGYDPAATEAMYNRKLADKARGIRWPGCKAFESEGCTDCATCMFKDKIKSPLNLATAKAPPPPPPPGPGGQPWVPLPLPEHYSYNPAGIICVDIYPTKKKGDDDDENTDPPEQRPMFTGRILAVTCEVDNETKTGSIRLEVETFKDEGSGGKVSWSIVIPNEYLASEQMLTNCLCRQVFTPTFNTQRYLVPFMRSFVQLCDDQKQRQESEAFGWMFDTAKGERCGFAYGGNLYLENGSVVKSSNNDPVLSYNYTPAGQEKPWHDLMEIISAQRVPALEVIAAVAWAAPVFWIRGPQNMTFWPFSRESAAFKSTSLYAALAVWGSPTRTKETRRCSIAALEGKIGRLRSLPVAMDELIDDDQVATLAENINTLSEGTSGGKARRNGGLRAKHAWQTILMAASNQSVREYYNTKRVSTDAGFMRVFEIELFRRPATHDGAEVHRLMTSLDYNYGHLGAKYAGYLAKNWRAIETAGLAIDKQFCAAAGAENEHRFWSAFCLSIILGAKLANIVAGKEYFHVDEIEKYLLECFKQQVQYVSTNVAVAGTKLSTEEILGQFLKAYHENQIWCDFMGNGAVGRPSGKPVVLGTFKVLGRNPIIHVRYNKLDRTVFISKAALNAFMDKTGGGAGAIFAGLKKQYHATQLRVSLSCALSEAYTQNKETCLMINIPPGHFLEESLMAFKQATAPALTAVSTPVPEAQP